MGKLHKQPAFFVLIFVLALAMVGVVLTSRLGPSPPASHMEQAGDQVLVDQGPLQTARALAPQASTPQESDLAQQAMRLADHEVDLAFASALRQASQHPQPATPQTRELDARLKRIEAVFAAHQAEVTRLAKAVEKASETEKDDLQQQLQLAQAQLALDRDELNDAKEDLARSGGDTHGKIQRMLDEHEASQHENGAKASNSSAPSTVNAANQDWPQSGSLFAQIQDWNSIRVIRNQVLAAQRDALNASALLSRSHE